MIRQATAFDIGPCVELAIEALSIDPYPELVIDRAKVARVTAQTIQSARHFSYVAEHEGKITGALAAMVAPNVFHERCMASVLMWYAKTPGDGSRLMRQLIAWVEQRPEIAMVTYTGERGADPRVGKLVKRLGLNQELPLSLMMR